MRFAMPGTPFSQIKAKEDGEVMESENHTGVDIREPLLS